MKKIVLFLSVLLFVVGCSCSNDRAADAVEEYFNNYKSLSENVLKDIDDLTEKENLTEKQTDTYEDIIKKQYRNLNFLIENENYNGDTAKVTVKITVYDLYKASKNASAYLNDHPEEFLTNGSYDKNKYLDYKLSEMQKMNDTINYNVVINTVKVDGKWQVEQPNEVTLEKIHGIYNYEETD